MMRSLFKKLFAIITHAQVLCVLLAFALMVFLSYYYMSNIERRHLLANVDNAILNTQSHIITDLLEPETALGVTAENVRNLILNGSDSDEVSDYLHDIAEYLTNDKRLMYTTTVYGYFDVFDGKILTSFNWIRPDDFIVHERPWYIKAVETGGKVGVTEPYYNIIHGVTTLTFARRIFDDNGKPLGIVCLDVLLDRIREYAVNTAVSEGGYGILLDKNFNVLAHPIPEYIGRNLVLMNDGAAIKEELLKNAEISERTARDYNQNESILFIRRLNNGWYLGIMAYADKYYQSVKEIGSILIVLGSLLALALIAILLSIVSSKKKAEERTRIMLDSVPICAEFWDKNFNIIDCNQEALKLFDCSSKKEYFEKFFDFSPEYQPDGSLAREKSIELLKKAFETGFCRFEWLHQKHNGDFIPSEVTLIRVKYRNEDIVCGYTRDMREINEITSKLREADERTMLMLDAAPLGVTMWDRNMNLIDFNYEAARVLGIYSKEEYHEKFMGTAPEYQDDGRKSSEVMPEFINKTFREGQNHMSWSHNTVNGEIIPFDASAVRLVLRDEPVVVIYCHDVRELNKALNKMKEADECRQALFDTTPLGCFMIDSSFNVLECNQEILRLFELKDKNEYIEYYFNLSPEYQTDGRKSYDKQQEVIQKTIDDGFCSFEWTHRKLSGELIPCAITLVSVMLRNDKVICGYIQDLREIKTMMVKMREADECTQVMFDATPLSCFLIDNDLKIIECNQEIVRLFDLKDKNEFMENIFDFFPERQPSGEISKEAVMRYNNEAFEEGYCRFEMMHCKRDGELIPTEVTLVRVKFKGVYAVAGYIRDLRELKLMIAEMRRAEIAEESSKAKSDFLAKMSHEIRTPMNAILGITEIQLQDNSLPLVTKEALERIYNSGDLLLGIINDILDLSKIEAGKFELLMAHYDIASLIHDTVKLNIMRYESKPIDFKLVIDENIPSEFTGDELRIKQILNNLLSNAFKYTQEGQVEFKLSSEIKNDKKNADIILRISDTGQGMTAEQVRRLGDKFSRFNMEANRKTEGTGLGMNITINLIELMGGKLKVESTPGMGSIFTVNLPQECVNPQPIGSELAENLMKLNLKNTTKMRNAQITQDFMPYGRVLVIDDVETNLYVARGLLAPYGISVDTALSGFEAIEKIRDGAQYDIIFMDHMMPRMDGIEATKHIRNMGYKKPVVALTANALAGQAEMFMKNGFDGFISKPIDIRQLNNVLNKMIRDKQTKEVIENASKQKNRLYAAGGHNIAIDQHLAEIFVRDAKKALNVLNVINENKSRRSDDISTFIINVHAMKSALINVGESDLSNEASNLEHAGREKNTGLILSSLPSFIEKLNNVINKLTPKDDEDVNVTEEDINLLKEKLNAIENACASYNKKAAKEALNSVKQKAWPRPVKDQLSAISEHLLHSEFDEVAAITKDFKFN